MLKNHSEVLLVICLIIVVGIFSPRIIRSHVKTTRFKDEIEVISRRILKTKKQISRIESIMDNSEDEYYLEKEIRNRLNFQKSDEVIFKYKKENY